MIKKLNFPSFSQFFQKIFTYFHFNTIKSKMILLILITLIPISAFKAIEIQNNFNCLIDSEFKSSQDLAQAISLSFTHYLDKLWLSGDIIGLTITSNTEWSKDDINNYLRKVQKTAKFSEVSWVLPDGDILASTNANVIGKNIITRDYIQSVLNGQGKVVSNLIRSIDNNKIIIPVARAIKVNQQLKGIFVIVLTEDDISSAFTVARDGKTSSYGIIDKNGMIVYRYGTPNIPFTKRKINSDSPAWKSLDGQIVWTKSFQSNLAGDNRMGVNYPINSIGWSCFVSSNMNEVLHYPLSNLTKEILLLIFIFISSFVVAVILGNTIVRRVHILKEATQELKKGNLSARTNIKGNDELSIVSQGFDAMANSLEEYDKLKSQFITNLSHELKTPLNIIYTSTQTILKIKDTAETSDYNTEVSSHMRIIKQNCFRLMRIIGNIIDISKIESGFFPVKMQNYNIVSIVEDITLSVVKYADAKGIEITFDTDAEEKSIACDPDLIERIILNLISNALKFTDRGGEILVMIHDKGDTVAISVKDTGIGIQKDKLTMIFERFNQVDASLSRNTEGSGLGLSIVNALVHAHSGKISVLSELGLGSEFIIELPASALPDSTLHSPNHTYPDNYNEKINIEFSDIYSTQEMDKIIK